MQNEGTKETTEFLESLSVDQMRRLLNGNEVFLDAVLEHAVYSKKVSNIVDAVLDQEYAEMPEHARRRLEEMAKRVRQRCLKK